MVGSLAIKVVGAIVAAIVVILAIPRLFGRAARLRRKLRSTKQCAVHRLTDGASTPRRIAGMVVGIGQPLIAPLSGRPCVFYETRVVRHIGLGLDPWDIDYEVAVERRAVPFLVDDGTGSAVVDAARAETLLDIDIDRWSGEHEEDAAVEDAFLERFGQRRRGLLFSKRLHFTESVIEIGERVAVMGIARREPEPSSSAEPYRHHPLPVQPRLTRSPQSSLIITDDLHFAPPQDGE